MRLPIGSSACEWRGPPVPSLCRSRRISEPLNLSEPLYSLGTGRCAAASTIPRFLHTWRTGRDPLATPDSPAGACPHPACDLQCPVLRRTTALPCLARRKADYNGLETNDTVHHSAGRALRFPRERFPKNRL